MAGKMYGAATKGVKGTKAGGKGFINTAATMVSKKGLKK